MSRALDKHVKEALVNGDHELFYEKTSSALSQRHSKLLEIEFLGPSHQLEHGTSYLQDENALAIPKLQLIQAFIPARQRLNAYLSHQSNSSEHETLKATAVVLLMDAEHLTAANTRKRIVDKQLASNSQQAAEILSGEKYFIDSFLTSRLHRHTKSPNLWSHRRWLMSRYKSLSIPVDIVEDIRDVIFISGERHPRNYYAWCHARYLITEFGADPEVLSAAIGHTKKWCFTHHSDISGWMFLQFLLDRTENQVGDTFDETVKLAKSFHWRNESVWYFLRNMALTESKQSRIYVDFKKTLESSQEGATGEDRRILNRISAWRGRHRPDSRQHDDASRTPNQSTSPQGEIQWPQIPLYQP